jgi:glycosyltransferase involved in cell wall biosynthesis
MAQFPLGSWHLFIMKLVVDGLIYEKEKQGGISRVFSEILPRMCDLDPSLAVNLFTEKDRLRQAPPAHRQIAHRVIPRVDSYLRPRRVWGRRLSRDGQVFLRRWYMGSGKGALWHSTFYTLPDKWEGRQVVTFHDLGFQRLPHLFNQPDHEKHRERMHRCLMDAEIVIAVSEASSRDIQEFYGIDDKKIRVAPLGCSSSFQVLEQSALTGPTPTQRPFLLYVGHRMCYKNFDALLEAYGGWKQRKDVDLVVVGGKGWSAEERHLLAKHALAEHVHAVGSVDDLTLARLYNQAAVFVFPSLYEGFGIPLLEAMACGCPIVSSRIPSSLEVAGDCAVYFEPTAIDGLMAALDTAVSAGRKSPRIARGLQKAREYSWDTTARLTLAAYQEAMGLPAVAS